PFGSLFPRIELDLNDQQDTENTGEETVSENISQVDMAQFRNMDIRVAEVVQAEHIEGSKKLLRMDVDIGKETTQIVAGIAHQYKPEDLVGKRIVVLVNLKPTTLMGYQSNGMLLAASRGEKLSLLGLDREIEPGSRVM
ncbi:MAG: methionine--tRNA ligase subunit beta, partial [Spirochaetota bacterium]